MGIEINQSLQAYDMMAHEGRLVPEQLQAIRPSRLGER